MIGRLPLLALAAVAASAASAAGIVYAGGAWAAIDRGGTCEALSRSQRVAAKGKVQAIAGFSFTLDHRRWGEFHARLRRMPRAGAAVMLRIDDQPFLLVSRGNEAWSEGPLQEQAIIAALRGGDRDERRIARLGGPAVRRSLFARRSGHRDRRRGGLRWQNAAAITR